MADIMLHTTSASSVTCVSNIFIDDFMKDANGEYVKIYLYLLRCLGRDGYEFSIPEVADRLEHTERDVMKALTYWEKVGLLRLEYSSDNELSGICLVDVNGYDKQVAPVVTSIPTVTFNAPTASATAVGAPVTAKKTTPEKPVYSAEEINAFSSQDVVQDLLFAASMYMARPLSATETNSVLYWFDSLHMSIDLIEYLIENCIDNGHSSFHYMDTVARNWTEDGIKTVEDAKNSAKVHSTTVYSIMKAMGISNRDLIPAEMEFIDTWTKKYHFDIEIICEACKRAVLKTNHPSFNYAETILSSWNKKGVKSLEDVAMLDKAFVKATVTDIAEKKPAAKTARPKVSKFGFDGQRENNDELDDIERALLKIQ